MTTEKEEGNDTEVTLEKFFNTVKVDQKLLFQSDPCEESQLVPQELQNF